jgi:hypothetical protein
MLFRRAGRSSRAALGTMTALLLVRLLVGAPGYSSTGIPDGTTAPLQVPVTQTQLPPPIPDYPAPTYDGEPLAGISDYPAPTYDGAPLASISDYPLPTYEGVVLAVSSDYPSPTYNGVPLAIINFL